MSQLLNASFRLKSPQGDASGIAHSLRRALFSSVAGAAVSEVRIKDVPHEFCTLSGVKEDSFEVVRNLSKLKFEVEGEGPATFEANLRGPRRIVARDLTVSENVRLIEPAQYVAELGRDGWLALTGKIASGTGHRQATTGAPPGTVYLDCHFSPVRRVLCTVESDAAGDSILVSLATDGRVSPREALNQAMPAAGCEALSVEELEPEHHVESPDESSHDFSKVGARAPIPSLTGLHRQAFRKFLDEKVIGGLGEIFPVSASDGSAELDLLGVRVEPPDETAEECLKQGKTLAGSLFATLSIRS
ncbi:MAG: hypothetical protein QF473_12505, partial [Planctomycetota bacterium]|nr:hypothetical protein [Planctomycetota bacterium]